MPAAVGQLHRLPSHTHYAVCYSTSPIPMGRLPSSVYHYNQHTYHCRIFYQKIRCIEQISLLVLFIWRFKRSDSSQIHYEAPCTPDITGLYDANNVLLLKYEAYLSRIIYIEKPLLAASTLHIKTI